MSNRDKYELKNCNHLTVIPVIASFDTTRSIKPLYIRINEESFKVYKAIVIETFLHQTTYQCEIEDGEYIKHVKLTYFANESLWAIHKKSSM